jgi:hypothetical protein
MLDYWAKKLTPVSACYGFSAFPIFFLRSGNFALLWLAGRHNLAVLNNQKFAVFLKNRTQT